MVLVTGIILAILVLSGLYLALSWRKFLNAFQIELEPNQDLPALHQVPYETLFYPTENRKVLKTWLLKQPGTTAPVALVAHGWTRNASFLWPVSYALWKAGFTVFALNARNHGESDVDPPMSVFKYAEDMSATFRIVQTLYPGNPVVVAGHSLGASAGLIFAARNSAIKAIAAICPFSSSRDIFCMDIRQAKVPMIPFGFLLLKIAERHIGHSFRELAPVTYMPQLRAKTLLIAAENDLRIPAGMQNELASAAPEDNKPERLVIPDASHTSLLTGQETLDSVTRFLTSAPGIRELLPLSRKPD